MPFQTLVIAGLYVIYSINYRTFPTRIVNGWAQGPWTIPTSSDCLTFSPTMFEIASRLTSCLLSFWPSLYFSKDAWAPCYFWLIPIFCRGNRRHRRRRQLWGSRRHWRNYWHRWNWCHRRSGRNRRIREHRRSWRSWRNWRNGWHRRSRRHWRRWQHRRCQWKWWDRRRPGRWKWCHWCSWGWWVHWRSSCRNRRSAALFHLFHCNVIFKQEKRKLLTKK